MNLYTEGDLATVAKRHRIAAGKLQRDAAGELGVARPSVVFAENNPERNLLGLRKRMIEAYSSYRVEGPFYRLVKKSP
ncbi:MAG TPA: hypothetical protein VMF06_07945 [Candidatus Limnocylindria bacterium]|jgi:DNA-binding XRE family transcriptional regulator|nr:hypothetical protein [Candidatus Limnocylindria bacterium]